MNKENYKRILQLAWLFAEVHLDDSDCLGKASEELYNLLENENIEYPKEYDC